MMPTERQMEDICMRGRIIEAAVFAAAKERSDLDGETLTRADYEKEIADDPAGFAGLRAVIVAALDAGGTEAAAEIERLRAKLAEAERIVSPAECDENCDDPDCPYSHVPLTLQAAYENSVSRMKDAEARTEAAEKRLAEAREVIEPFGRCADPWSAYDDTENLVEPWAGDPGECPLTVGHLRAAAEWMEKIAGPDDMRAPLGARFTIDHDGFVGTVIGYYRRHDGKRGVVLQQDGTKVVHVYGEIERLRAEKDTLARALFWFAKYPEFKPNPDRIDEWLADLEAARPLLPKRRVGTGGGK